MEIGRKLNLRTCVIIAYFLALAAYIIYGLQPAEAASYEISASLQIPAISLTTDVTRLKLENNALNTPDTITGSFTRGNTTLLIGHSTTVFKDLHLLHIGRKIIYDDEEYIITNIATLPKSEVSVDELLARQSDNKKRLVIMTCAGELLQGGDATHRLIITASKK